MKLILVASLVLTVGLADPPRAETPVPDAGPCSINGPADSGTDECRKLRLTYQAEVGACMTALKVEADRRQGTSTMGNAHSSRARFLRCSAATQAKLGLAES